MTEPKTLRITYRDETLQERGREALQRAAEGDAFDPVIQVNLTDPNDLDRLVSVENLELLTAIVEEEPASISKLAEAVEREYKSVHRNCSELATFGVVEFEESKGRKRPVLRAGADALEVAVSVGSADADRDPVEHPT